MNEHMSKPKKPTSTDPKWLIANSDSIKPDDLVISSLKWKYLIRSILRGRNVLLTGPAGSGKTLAVQRAVEALDRKESHYFHINMGATQDPRSSLIGNTFVNKSTGTLFSESPFIKAVRTPNTVIHLEELSRAHPEACNILMTPLDYLVRSIRLDEKETGETVKVAEGVSFVATANIGSEYTATRILDAALLSRFTVKIEVDMIDRDSEEALIKKIVPNANFSIMGKILSIAKETREQLRNGKLSKAISTRSVVEMATLTEDGFSLSEILEAAVYPDYSAEEGTDSERTFVMQCVQKHSPASNTPRSAADLQAADPSDDEKPPF